MVELNCPLCCNETFTSRLSLKTHILNILENICCRSCDEKFETLANLAKHLENDCGGGDLIISKGISKHQDISNKNALGEDSILAKALLGGLPTDNQEEENLPYYCQMCSMHLDNVEEHLKYYHDGQEVIMEEDESGQILEEPPNGESVYIVESTIDQEDNNESGVAVDINLPLRKRVNTISEEDIKDKQGRPYTRKLVKIDKFWMEEAVWMEETVSGSQSTGSILTALTETNEAKIDGNEIEINKCANCKSYYPVDTTLYGTHTCMGPRTKVSKKKQSESFNCEVCNTIFPTFKSLRLHKRMHDPVKLREIEVSDDPEKANTKTFICKVCNKTYDRKYESIHMASHDGGNSFNCNTCNRKFFSDATLQMHMKAHSNNKKFTCSYCKKPFITFDALNDHLANQCQKRQYVCQFCGRRFARPHEKVKHERIHTGEKPHVCDICGKAFRVSYCLTLHLRTHSGTRPYHCQTCGKRFKSHSVYNHHLLTHSDLRNYKCPFCPKAFKTSVQLAGHKNSHIKPFTCTECNRPFASLYAVRAHMDTHKRDNNLKHECWICGALYSRTFALRDHLRQQHHFEHESDDEKMTSEALVPDEELEAANSIMVTEEDIILGLDSSANIEIIENEGE